MPSACQHVTRLCTGCWVVKSREYIVRRFSDCCQGRPEFGCWLSTPLSVGVPAYCRSHEPNSFDGDCHSAPFVCGSCLRLASCPPPLVKAKLYSMSVDVHYLAAIASYGPSRTNAKPGRGGRRRSMHIDTMLCCSADVLLIGCGILHSSSWSTEASGSPNFLRLISLTSIQRSSLNRTQQS